MSCDECNVTLFIVLIANIIATLLAYRVTIAARLYMPSFVKCRLIGVTDPRMRVSLCDYVTAQLWQRMRYSQCMAVPVLFRRWNAMLMVLVIVARQLFSTWNAETSKHICSAVNSGLLINNAFFDCCQLRRFAGVDNIQQESTPAYCTRVSCSFHCDSCQPLTS